MGATIALEGSEAAVFVSDSDNRAIHEVDLPSGIAVTTALDGTPEQLVRVGPRLLAVTLRDRNQVAVVRFDANRAGTVVARADVATEPWGIAATAKGDLLVTSAWGHALTLLDAVTLRPRWSIDVSREPRSVVIAPDGSRAFVTHLMGDAITVVDLRSTQPLAHALHALGAAYHNRVDQLIGAGTMHPTSALAYAAVISESGGRLFVPHVIEQNSSSSEHLVPGAYGGVPVEEETSVAAVAVVGVRDEHVLSGATRLPSKDDPSATKIARQTTALMVDPAVGFAVAPRTSPARQARAAIESGEILYVLSQGTREVVEMDARSLDPAMDVIRRIPVGDGPTGLVIDPDRHQLVVWNQLSHDLSTIELETGRTKRLAVAGDPLASEVAEGRRLFFTETDKRISRDGRACAACHPEGRDDGVVWKLGAGPRQTPTLLGRLGTGPFGWEAKHDELVNNMRETMGRLGGGGMPAQKLAALAAYLQHGLLVPTRNVPQRNEAARGRELFVSTEVGCSGCHHLETDGSDRQRHDIGSRAHGDAPSAFRTPPLAFVGGTGPYFHDGRYATLDELLENNYEGMGQTSQLSPADRHALIAFLGTL
jgi:DNA-binding beta-propeller fold protein YncE